MSNSQIHRTSPLWPIGIFFLCALLIVATFYALFESIKANEREDTNKTLASIGQLKTNQIWSYLTERKSDAAAISSLLTTQSAQHWLKSQAGAPPAMLNQLSDSIVKAYQYRGVLLLDTEANLRFNTKHSGTLTEAGKTIALRTMRERSPASFQIYFGDPSSPDIPVLDTFVLIMNPGETKVMGIIVMRSELDYLFQLIQTWPVDSDTGESLLVTREGDDVLFLNELRYKKNTALKFRIPINKDTGARVIPTVEMLRKGRFGLIEGYDYRDLPTLGYNIAVPETSWGMVVKIDLEEAIAHSLKLQRTALTIALAFIVFTWAFVWLWWRDNKTDWLANQQLQESEARYRRLYESMRDAFVMVDMSGKLIESNSAYREMLGYSADELQRLTYVELTPEQWHKTEARIIKEQIIPHDYSQVYEKEYIHKNGTIFPVELKTFLLRDENGQPEAMWAIVRDITERKRVERQLQDLSAHLQTMREEEKARIAREIHDDLGGTLAALKIETYRLTRELSTSGESTRLLNRVNSMSQLLDGAVTAIRRIITDLRPTILDDLGLVAALEWQASEFHKTTGIVCRLNCVEGKCNPDGKYSIALFRIFQEALTNAAKHSGASRVEVEFQCNEEEITLSVSDNGCGLPDKQAASPTSYGLRGMCERVEQLGGNIKFEKSASGGFSVTVSLPLPVKNNEEVIT